MSSQNTNRMVVRRRGSSSEESAALWNGALAPHLTFLEEEASMRATARMSILSEMEKPGATKEEVRDGQSRLRKMNGELKSFFRVPKELMEGEGALSAEEQIRYRFAAVVRYIAAFLKVSAEMGNYSSFSAEEAYGVLNVLVRNGVIRVKKETPEVGELAVRAHKDCFLVFRAPDKTGADMLHELGLLGLLTSEVVSRMNNAYKHYLAEKRELEKEASLSSEDIMEALNSVAPVRTGGKFVLFVPMGRTLPRNGKPGIQHRSGMLLVKLIHDAIEVMDRKDGKFLYQQNEWIFEVLKVVDSPPNFFGVDHFAGGMVEKPLSREVYPDDEEIYIPISTFGRELVRKQDRVKLNKEFTQGLEQRVIDRLYTTALALERGFSKSDQQWAFLEQYRKEQGWIARELAKKARELGVPVFTEDDKNVFFGPTRPPGAIYVEVAPPDGVLWLEDLPNGKNLKHRGVHLGVIRAVDAENGILDIAAVPSRLATLFSEQKNQRQVFAAIIKRNRPPLPLDSEVPKEGEPVHGDGSDSVAVSAVSNEEGIKEEKPVNTANGEGEEEVGSGYQAAEEGDGCEVRWASTQAKTLAEEHNIDVSLLVSKEGRKVTKADVERVLAKK